MDFLANENIPLASVDLLKQMRHRVVQEQPGTIDRIILERAHREKLILLTFDRDYGELLFRYGMPAPKGVVYFRFIPVSPVEPAESLIHWLENENIVLDRMFTILERDRIRQKPL